MEKFYNLLICWSYCTYVNIKVLNNKFINN